MEKATQLQGNLTSTEAHDYLISADIDWYVVRYTDGSFDCRHETGLSSILECGLDPADYGIADMYGCWGGEEQGPRPW